MELSQPITGQEHLRTVYREPGQGAIDKVIDHVDAGAASFLASAPFMVLATASGDRVDASPRGGPPGFIRVLDRSHLAWGDLTGNNRLDSFENLVERPDVGLVVMVPGLLETLRVRGTASLAQDPEVLEACAIDGRVAKTAVVVTVRECYIQCGAALRRSAIWEPETWPGDDARPSAGAIIKGHAGADVAPEEIEAGLAHYYDTAIWNAGGRRD